MSVLNKCVNKACYISVTHVLLSPLFGFLSFCFTFFFLTKCLACFSLVSIDYWGHDALATSTVQPHRDLSGSDKWLFACSTGVYLGLSSYRYKPQTMTVEQCCKIRGPDLSQGLLQPCQQQQSSYQIRIHITI